MWYLSSLTLSDCNLSTVQHQATVSDVAPQAPHHSSRQMRWWWWIIMYQSQMSASLVDTQWFSLDRHDLASSYHNNVNSRGIILLGIRWVLRRRPYVMSVPSSYIPPPPLQLSSCADVNTLSQFMLSLLNICFSFECFIMSSPPMLSLGFSVTEPV